MSDIVGYTYQAENYSVDAMREILVADNIIQPDNPVDVEYALDAWAYVREIDRQDEHSFDTDDFPKVIFSWQLDAELDSDWYDFEGE